MRLGLDRARFLRGFSKSKLSAATGGVNTTVAAFMFVRDKRVRLDWPVFKALDRYDARLIDRSGRPLRARLKVEPQDAGVNRRLLSEILLAPLGRGDYLIELTAAAGAVTETRLLARRVRQLVVGSSHSQRIAPKADHD
jgi:hypothetical protein